MVQALDVRVNSLVLLWVVQLLDVVGLDLNEVDLLVGVVLHEISSDSLKLKTLWLEHSLLDDSDELIHLALDLRDYQMSFILLAPYFSLHIGLLLFVKNKKLRLESALLGFNFVLQHQVLKILLRAEVDLSKLRIRKFILTHSRNDILFS